MQFLFKMFYMYNLKIFTLYLLKIWIKQVLCEIDVVLVVTENVEILCFMNTIYEIMF